MAVGNTFGATALSSYGGFWIAYGILLTPSWNILGKDGPYGATPEAIPSAVGFFLTGWFIFTTLLLLCTLKSNVMFFLLFFTLDLAFLFLACENYAAAMGNNKAKDGLQIAGGLFGMFAAFLAWYNALAGIQDSRLVLHRRGVAQVKLTSPATLSSSSRSSTSHGRIPAKLSVPSRRVQPSREMRM
jgi:succinate-acetate transporter protein